MPEAQRGSSEPFLRQSSRAVREQLNAFEVQASSAFTRAGVVTAFPYKGGAFAEIALYLKTLDPAALSWVFCLFRTQINNDKTR